MLSRTLAALGVAAWSFLVLSTAMALATSPGSWLIALGIGVIAPIILMIQINRAISLHENRNQGVPDSGDKERELLQALKDRGDITPATAAMRTSLTVEEAARMLEKLASKGHLKLLNYDGALAYSLFERDQIEAVEYGDDPEAWQPTAVAPAKEVANGSLNGKASPELLLEPLSEREREVLVLLASGRTNSEIAGELYVAAGTVKTHVNNIYRKLDARNRAEALARAHSAGLLG